RFSELFKQYLRNISVRECEEDYFCARTCTRAAEWLEARRGDAPVFLWVDLFDPHEPWDPPLEYKKPYNPGYEGSEIIDPVPSAVDGYLDEDEMENVRALYAGEVTFVDKWVGKLLDEARRLGYFDDSMIIFTSDHGEPLDDHGIVRKHKPWCFEELVSVPMIVHTPDSGGERVEALVQHCDIAPTICEAASVEVMPGTHGHSILPLVEGRVASLRDYALTGIHNQSGNIRDLRWSYLRACDRAPELYDRENDPTEQHNVIAEFPEIAGELDRQMHERIDCLQWE
ncbi:MAG: sulfatase, partial [Armatimonadota bacterium]